MPLTGAVSDTLLVALIKAPIRQNAPARENAGQRPEGRHERKDGRHTEEGEAGLIAANGLGGLTEGAADIDKTMGGVDKLKALADTVLSISPWLLGSAAGLYRHPLWLQLHQGAGASVP